MSTERQSKVELQTLLSRLAEIGIQIDEYDLAPNPYKLYMLGCKLPAFPFGDREYVWYPLRVTPGQTEIDRDEADAVLRHCWHSARPFFEDELEQELEPTSQHEIDIAAKVDVKARELRDAGVKLDEPILQGLKASMGFELSESESEYLEARFHWRQEIPISN